MTLPGTTIHSRPWRIVQAGHLWAVQDCIDGPWHSFLNANGSWGAGKLCASEREARELAERWVDWRIEQRRITKLWRVVSNDGQHGLTRLGRWVWKENLRHGDQFHTESAAREFATKWLDAEPRQRPPDRGTDTVG